MTDLAKVLELVNKGRVALGWKPLTFIPAGQIEEPYDCPIANCFENDFSVGDEWIGSHNEQNAKQLAEALGSDVTNSDAAYRISTPPLLHDFILEFDSGKYPELILEPEYDDDFFSDDEDESLD